MSVKVSIVVAVFNSSEYLTKCVQSILHQTLTELELILVDDGSTDGSGRLCDDLALRDSRIRVLHQRNQGPAAARNSGMSIAGGKYIGFVDSDDWVDDRMYEVLYMAAEQNTADMAFCDYWKEDGTAPHKMSSYPSPTDLFDRAQIERRFLPYFFGYSDAELHKNHRAICPFADYSSYIWLCIFRTELIWKNHLLFPDEKKYYNEDNLFNLNFLFYARTIRHIPEAYYHYRANDSSFTRKFNAGYADMRLSKYAFLSQIILREYSGADYGKRLNNKIALESVNVINYYVKTKCIPIREKYRKVKEFCRSGPVANALRSFHPYHLPFSRLSVFLFFEKHAVWPAVMILSLVNAKLALKNETKA